MVQESSRKKLSGLDVNTNPLNLNLGTGFSNPTGRTLICDNALINRTGMLANRWGLNYWTNGIASQVLSFFEYQSMMIQWQGDNTLWRGSGISGARTQYTGTFPAPVGFRTDGTVSQGNFYYTTTNAPYKLDSVTATPRRAGLAKGLDVRVTATGNPGWMDGFGEVAYRITWKRTDANTLTTESAVSEPFQFTTNNRTSISSLTRAVSTATATTTTNHGYATNDWITVSGATQPEYNITAQITVTGPTTFTYTVAGAPATPATGTIIADKYQNTAVAFTAPWDALSTDTWSVYRTKTSLASAPSAGDVMYLVGYGTLAGSAAVLKWGPSVGPAPDAS